MHPPDKKLNYSLLDDVALYLLSPSPKNKVDLRTHLKLIPRLVINIVLGGGGGFWKSAV